MTTSEIELDRKPTEGCYSVATPQSEQSHPEAESAYSVRNAQTESVHTVDTHFADHETQDSDSGRAETGSGNTVTTQGLQTGYTVATPE